MLMHATRSAHAEAPRVFLAEPTNYTNVLDAFVGKGLPDFRLSLGFLSTSETSTIQRENPSHSQAGSYSHVAFASLDRTAKQIWISAEVGLFQDLMLTLNTPFVLEDSLTLAATPYAVQSGLLDHAVGADYDSRIRDGVPYINAGLAYGLINQYRTPNLPTWIVRLDAQISTGQAMTPCLHGQSCFRGAGRGTVRVQGETRFSYRYRLVEPYGGFSYAREAVTTAQDNYWPNGTLPNDLDRNPPSRAGWTAGLSLIPWEDRERMQRIAVDGRFSATYVSRGRDYSPLFDILGTSPLLSPDMSTAATTSARFTGMTTIDAHVDMRGDLELLVRAARYVRFRFGLGISAATAHLITGASPCAAAVTSSGTCEGGQDNPSYQPIIDRPGNRFRITDIIGVSLSASAAGQF